jgi:protein-tyrosine phosphatase
LFVCSGNTCRSPMAMGLLAHHLAARGMDARVHSAGTLGWGGPATAHAVEVLAEREIDLTDHESRRLSGDVVATADLLLGMTRDHVGGVVAHEPTAGDRAFVMGELPRLGRRVGPRRPGQSLRDWCAEVSALRPANRPPGLGADEIDDPVGMGIDVYRATADRLDALCAEIAALVAPDGVAPEVVDIDPVDSAADADRSTATG